MNKITRLLGIAFLAFAPAFVSAQSCIQVGTQILLAGNTPLCTDSTGLLNAPQAIWPGVVSSTAAEVGAWPPAIASPSPGYTYNLYRNGTKIVSGIVPALTEPGSQPQVFYLDQTLTASTAYTYWWTGEQNGIETNPSPTWSFTTLAGNTTPTTAPAPPTDPATWIVPYSLPTGGTTWKATNTSSNNATCTPSAGVATGCGLQYALNAANINGGDIIVLTAGAIYSGNFTTPVFTGTNSWTYIVSSQDPGYNGSGTLPAYTTNATPLDYTATAITSSLIANATGATLSTAWTGRSGAYPTLFIPTTAGAVPDTRSVTYTKGLTSVTWSVGLVNAASPTLYTAILSGVTPFDITPSMATISFPYGSAGIGLTIPPGTDKLRIVGINITPTPSITAQMYYAVYAGALAGPDITNTPCAGVYFDRDLIGPDTATYGSGMSFVTHGIGAVCNNLLVHQSYIRGIANDSGGGGRAGGDANAIFNAGGGQIAIEQNYIEGQSEGVLFGGTYIAQSQQVHDIVYRYNYNTKPTQWLANTLGESPKNHFELKMGQRIAAYGNLHQGNWSGLASEGQHGRSFVIGARDQTSAVTSYTVTGITQGNCSPTCAVVTAYNPAAAGTQPFTVGGTIIVSGITAGMTQINNIEGTVTAIGGMSGAWTATTNINSSAFTAWSAGGLAYTTTVLGECPYLYVSDVNIHDNKIYGVNSGAYLFTGDYSATAWTGRVNFQNNIVQIAPGIPVSGTKDQGYGLWADGIVPDVSINQNTFIIDPTNIQNSGLYTAGIYDVSSPNTVYSDRWTFTNNIFDGTYAIGGTGENGGTTVLNAFYTNYTWNDNLTVLDNETYPTGTFKDIAYGSIGFNAWTPNALPPVSGSNADITATTTACASASCSGASTAGGPIGAYFEPSLAAQNYPRFWLDSVSPGTYYATSAWQNEAAYFNGVTISGYIGDEQTIGETHNAIFAAIKTKSLSYGAAFPTLGSIYYMPMESSVDGVTGNSPTFEYRVGNINASNWFLLSSYPSGSIVDSATASGQLQLSINQANLGANSVTLANSGPTVNPAPTAGMTFWAAEAYYWWQGYTQGTFASLFDESHATAACPHCDTFFLDNQNSYPVVTGAWAQNTTSYPPNATTSAWLQQGNAQGISAQRSVDHLLLIGNSDWFEESNYHSTALDPTGVALYDAIFDEAVIGQSYSLFAERGFTTTFAQGISAEQQVNASGAVIWNVQNPSASLSWPSTQSSWTTAEWQAWRSYAAWAQMRGYYFAPGQYSNSTLFVGDEMYQNGTVGWLGPAIDPPQSTPYYSTLGSLGVYRRRFLNGEILWNPPGNGNQTVTDTFTGFKYITTTLGGDGTTNSGLAVGASVSLPESGYGNAVFLSFPGGGGSQ
jgi:hypothetical protein